MLHDHARICLGGVRSFGFSVRTAEDGFVALKILREVLPDLILTDLRMPGMSGFELLSIVPRRFPHIPTIAISGEYILATMPLGLLVDGILLPPSFPGFCFLGLGRTASGLVSLQTCDWRAM
jgi:DNA-binding NarL/FixJ family response regulator